MTTIYVVENNAAVRDSLTAVLGSHGYAVETFASANDFLHALDLKSSGVLLLDIASSEIAAPSVVRELSDENIDIATIIISNGRDRDRSGRGRIVRQTANNSVGN